VGICSAATRAGFDRVVNSIVGGERLAKLDVIIAGDDVTRKKPDPMIYNMAAQRLGLPNDQ
jgi:beta-phosphoglucomutase-like phosphatase (HAD superfamily)